MSRFFIFISIVLIILAICLTDLNPSKSCFISKKEKNIKITDKCYGDGSICCKKCKRFIEDK